MEENEKTPSSLDHLVAAPRRAPVYNPFYSKIVRWMRLALPLAALAIIAVVFTWSSARETYIAREEKSPDGQKMGKNELLQPRFEGTDKDNQHYTLTAVRAMQDDKDEKLVLLETPKADLQMESGHWVAMEAQSGRFQQEQQNLLLQNGVRIFHDGGYQLDTAEMLIDLKNDRAVSETDVFAQGPEGTLAAKGLDGNNRDGVLLFKGPVKVVLTTALAGSGGLLR